MRNLGEAQETQLGSALPDLSAGKLGYKRGDLAAKPSKET